MERFAEKLARVLSEPIELTDYDPIWPSVLARVVTRVCTMVDKHDGAL